MVDFTERKLDKLLGLSENHQPTIKFRAALDDMNTCDVSPLNEGEPGDAYPATPSDLPERRCVLELCRQRTCCIPGTQVAQRVEDD